MRIALVILAINERQGLEELFPRIPLSSVDEVIAVDGGSYDGTVEFLKEKGITVIGQKVAGRGEAFRLAFEATIADALIFFGPDGNENPDDIPKFRPHLERGSDIVVANRMSHGGVNEEDIHFFRWRKWANNAFTLLANLTWGRGRASLIDSINGFRAIRRSAWTKLALDGSGYTIEYQCSIRSLQLGLKVDEFPTTEGQRIDRREGAPSLATGLAFLSLYFRELARSFTGERA